MKKIFESFLTKKIDCESQSFTVFDNFYSIDRMIQKLFNELVVGFELKEKPGKMCNSVALKVMSY